MNRWLGLSQLAKTRKGKESGAGYTITELLIVLAVTTVMFAAIVVAFSGRQARAEFNQAVRNFETKLQAAMNEVTNGHFDTGYSCNGSIQPQGKNKSCIFLGKTFAMREEQSEIMTVVGNRTVNSGGIVRDVETIAEAAPDALYNPSASNPYEHSFDIKIKRAFIMNASGGNAASIGAFAFLSQLGGGLSSGDNPVSGSRSLILYSVSGTSISSPFIVKANAVSAANLTPAPYGIRICLRSGDSLGGEHKAEITIGEQNTQTAIKTLIDEGIATGSECKRDD